MGNPAQNELRFENRWLRSQADLYSRRKGLKRWVKLGPASGVFHLDTDKEYRLKFRGVLLSKVESMLQGVNCDLLAEIEGWIEPQKPTPHGSRRPSRPQPESWPN